jgi:hypothetical protein
VLQLSPDGSVGRRCEVRWRSGMEIGVKFIARLIKIPAGSQASTADGP